MALSRPTREKVNDFVVWWNFHAAPVANYPLERKVEWLMRAVNSQNEIIVELAREMDGARHNRLALPAGFNMNFGKTP